MEDKFVRFTKLYIIIFLMFLSIPVIIGLIVAVFYGFSKLISFAPVDIVFQLLIMSVPTAVFATADIIFFIRTKNHPSPIVRVCSRILFAAGFICAVTFLVMDIVLFFKQPGTDIIDYHCFSIPFLAGNVGGLFLIAIAQAFTTKKETDWLDKTTGQKGTG